MREPMTYKEGRDFYALIPTCACSYLLGPFKSRSTARRHALARANQQRNPNADPYQE